MILYLVEMVKSQLDYLLSTSFVRLPRATVQP